MKTFNIRKNNKSLDGERIELEFKRLLAEKGARRPPELFPILNATGSFRDIKRGVLGVRGELYELEGEGVVLYLKWQTPFLFGADVHLLGFDEESECYKSLAEFLGRYHKKETS
jgi:hypothetical protein